MIHDPPFGQLYVEAGRAGVSRVRFGGDRDALLETNQRERSSLALEATEQIAQYLGGHRTVFDLQLDLGSATPFRTLVLRELLKIPFGETISYGELAGRVGCGSARAVGQAVGWNPLPILVPCHRVVTGDARLGGYSGGLDLKVALLRLEGIGVESSTFSGRITVPA